MLNWQTKPVANANDTQNPFQSIDSVGVASLFYKLAGATPNFEKWAATSERYHKAPEYDKDLILDEIVMLLREKYYNTFVDEFIRVSTNVSLKNYSARQEALFFDEITNDTYFAYNAFGEDFALVVKDIDKYNKIDMPENLYELIREEQNARVEFTLRPIRAETAEPMFMGDKHYWVIVCDIAQFRIWDNQKTHSLYTDNAPWFNDKSELSDLFSIK